MESGNKKIAVIVTVVVVVALVAVIVFSQRTSWPGGGGGTESATEPAALVTRTEAPVDTVVPEQGATVALNIAVPQNVTPLNAHTTETNRDFSITANNNKFTPDTIIVNAGDNININFTAVDKNYDFSQPDYGYGDGKFIISKGQTKKITFQVTASGKFMFYCALCGGPKSGPIGYIIAP